MYSWAIMMGMVSSRRAQVSGDEYSRSGRPLPDRGRLSAQAQQGPGRDVHQILVSGTKKFAVSEFVESTAYLRAKVAEVPMEIVEDTKIGATV